MTSDVSGPGLAFLKHRIRIWTLGTTVAGVVPVLAIVCAALLGQHRLPSWGEICDHGEFFVIAIVVTTAGISELASALLEEGELNATQRAKAAYYFMGAIMGLVGLALAYGATYLGSETDVVFEDKAALVTYRILVWGISPLAWVGSGIFATRCLKLRWER